MTRLAFSDYLDHLRGASARFRSVLSDCDPQARVPACPDWDAADLLWHLAEVQWFWSDIVTRRPAGPVEDGARPERADSYPGLLEQYDACSAGLVAALEAADPAEPAWSWAEHAPDGQSVGFSFRRQAHEALIHRIDAEQTAGLPTPLDPALAADGVAEALGVMYGGEAPAWARLELGRHHVRVDLTDVGVSLWVRPCTLVGTDPASGRDHHGPHVLLVDDPEVEPAAVLSASAGEVDSWLWQRADRSTVTMQGDPAALAELLSALSPPIE